MNSSQNHPDFPLIGNTISHQQLQTQTPVQCQHILTYRRSEAIKVPDMDQYHGHKYLASRQITQSVHIMLSSLLETGPDKNTISSPRLTRLLRVSHHAIESPRDRARQEHNI